MAQQVPWDQRILDEFIRRSLLSEEDQWIMRSRSQQAEHLGLSKAKHDHVQPNLQVCLLSGGGPPTPGQ